ncbi:hypothetical protein [Pseudomonas sp. RIT-To-2]|uniref:hypothetical protein n=1 Tax=Pseudomonas sp. RIT-To-2 TaxID=3462541 RepID=UPI0024132BD1
MILILPPCFDKNIGSGFRRAAYHPLWSLAQRAKQKQLDPEGIPDLFFIFSRRFLIHVTHDRGQQRMNSAVRLSPTTSPDILIGYTGRRFLRPDFGFSFCIVARLLVFGPL